MFPDVIRPVERNQKGLPRPASKTSMIAPIQRLTTALIIWYDAHGRDLPWRRRHDPYAIWISEIMLQQTQVKTVVPYWNRWMKELPSISSLAQIDEDRLHKLWEGLGYYSRVRNLQKAARMIMAIHNEQFPESLDAVLSLPGIGRYTAGAICSIAFNQPTPILDGNVIRVLCRLQAISGDPKSPRLKNRLWATAARLVQTASRLKQAVIPPAASGTQPGFCSRLNQALMELGATVCTPRNPACDRCPVSRWCAALKQGSPTHYPSAQKRPASLPRWFAALVIERAGQFRVRQRPGHGVNAGLWEFPNVECPDLASTDLAAVKLLGTTQIPVQPLGVIRHSITRYRMTLAAFHASVPTGFQPTEKAGAWLDLPALHELAFTAAHKKILLALESRG
jgi:A/G-specific adenine glycosylase